MNTKLALPDVTLIQIDTVDPFGAGAVTAICTRYIDFGDVVICLADNYPQINDYESYNRFVVKELHTLFSTSHCLLIQRDGFILRPDMWRDDFLDYDYIGAPWFNYGPARTLQIHQNGIVGNGGFSLRSKAFCRLTSEFELERYSPEDQLMCGGPGWDISEEQRQIGIANRQLLESHGLQFAPVDLARKFSWEMHDNDPEYDLQFGFHGKHTLQRLRETQPFDQRLIYSTLP